MNIELTFCLLDRPNTDFPKKGIVFLDIFPLLRDPIAFEVSSTAYRAPACITFSADSLCSAISPPSLGTGRP